LRLEDDWDGAAAQDSGPNDNIRSRQVVEKFLLALHVFLRLVEFFVRHIDVQNPAALLIQLKESHVLNGASHHILHLAQVLDRFAIFHILQRLRHRFVRGEHLSFDVFIVVRKNFPDLIILKAAQLNGDKGTDRASNDNAR
jgi:hypothetical protein